MTKTNKKNILPNQFGYSLILTLFVIIFISVIGLSLITISNNTLKTSANERQDQAVYYVAEAALVEIKTILINAIEKSNNEVIAIIEADRSADKLKDIDYYRSLLSDKIKIHARSKSLNIVKTNPRLATTENIVNDFTTSTDNKVPKADYYILNDSNLTYTIETVGSIGNKKRTLTQTINITNPFNNVSLEKEEPNTPTIPGDNNNENKLNACFAVYANGAITSTSGGGTFEGDIYSNQPLTISGSPEIKGSIYSTEDIKIVGTPTSVKSVISEKNIELSGWNSISGNIHAGGYVKSNASVNGNILANTSINISGGTTSGMAKTNGTFTMSNGTVSSGVIAGNNVTVSGGTINGATKTNGTLSLTNGTLSKGVIVTGDATVSGGTINNYLVSNSNVFINNYPTINGNIIAKKNINIQQEWYEFNGELFLGGDTRSKKNTINKVSNIDTYLNPYITPFNTELANLRNEIPTKIAFDNECTTGIITLPDQSATFKNPSVGYSNDITLSGDSKLNLPLDNDIYLKNLNLYAGTQINIDLEGKEKNLYVDSLNMSNGFINLLNTGNGKLNIHVLKNFKIDNGAINYGGLPSNVNIYYSGTSPISIAGGVRVNSSLYVKNADLTLTAGGRVNGDIYVYGQNNVKLSGGTSAVEQLFLAPYSNFVQEAGAVVNGNIIANNYTFNGGIKVTPPTKNVPIETGNGDGDDDTNPNNPEDEENEEPTQEHPLFELSPPVEK